jgi:prepilin-type N-terminal cleavage/methylation domain-containing protein
LKRGFTLIELLLVVAVLGVLLVLAAPPMFAAIERARVGRVLTELQSIEVAIEAFRIDHGRYPPVTVSCMAADADEVLQLPRELADGGYLPPSPRTKASTLMRDPFNPKGTYKYAAPENYWMNGAMQRQRYPVWVPSDFPSGMSAGGRFDDSADSPLAWAVWSQGPRAQAGKGLNEKAPTARFTWYERLGDHGVIGRFKERNGPSWSTLQ